ncbi:MAG: hypothetical protein NT018_05710 [Armatimonadetes bacterium]|nr:hypothetical protein [Armatimonadota bacterium]
MKRKKLAIGAILVSCVLVAATVKVYFKTISCPPRSDYGLCRNNITEAEFSILCFLEKNGRLPIVKGNVDDEVYSAIVFKQIARWDKKWGFRYFMKCPKDKTDTMTSYRINSQLMGKSLKDIPEDKLSQVVLVYETEHDGTHNFVGHADGHIRSGHWDAKKHAVSK